MTQKQILEIVAQKGSYTADLIKKGNRISGIRNVSPAEELQKKGVLVLKEKKELSRMSFNGNSEVTRFVWIPSGAIAS